MLMPTSGADLNEPSWEDRVSTIGLHCIEGNRTSSMGESLGIS